MPGTRRLWVPVAILVAVAGCRDATAPLDEQNALGQVVGSPTPSTGMHILRQAPTAPPLETYQVSFCAHEDEASTIIVNYQPAPGQAVGQPFLRFDLPEHGLRDEDDHEDDDEDDDEDEDDDGDDRGQWEDRRNDPRHRCERNSVLLTLTIDPETFSVAFGPSGVVFSERYPATLAFWYGNAHPDLNGDGVVDAADQMLEQQLAIWGRAATPAPWLRTSSQTEAGQQWVWTALYHFSEYAVSW